MVEPCRYRLIKRFAPFCAHQGLIKRQEVDSGANTAPDGQVLPDWLTWSPYETTIDGEVLQTGEILQLPLTYYGPSIPLGPDWTYGGLTSPAPGEQPEPTFTENPDPRPSPSSPTSTDLGGTSASPSPPTGVETTSAGPLSPAPSEAVVSYTPILSLQTGPGPASLPSSDLSPTSLSSSSPSIPVPTTAAPTTTPPDSGVDLVPLLPAILVPLLTALALLLLLIYCFRRRERSRQGYTTAVGASSGGYGGWLTSSFSKRANGSGERFTSAWTPVPGEPKDKVSAANWAKSNERSALLGFIPNHHRSSSSVDHGARAVEGEAKGEKEKKGEGVKEEELEVLADRNQSLLSRLNLGLGWLSAASLASVKSRVASGHTLERGNGGPGSLDQSQSQKSSEKTGTSPATGNDSGAKAATTTSGSNAVLASPDLSHDQLFFRPPLETASLGSSSSPSPGRRSFFSRFQGKSKSKAGTTSSTSKRSSRRSWVSSSIVPEGDEDAPLTEGARGISVAMPITPSTLGEGDKTQPTKWNSRERLRFPVPPSSASISGGGGEKESLISSHNTEYHSAESNYSLPSGPPSELALPVPVPSSQKPFDKGHTDYAPPALSPFGSKESFTPTATVSKRSPSLRDLFSTSSGARPSMDSGGGDSGGNRRSFVGQPIIDEDLLHAISTGRGASYAGLGGIDEFGQTVRNVSGEAPTIVNDSRWSRSHESEIASFHSSPSSHSSNPASRYERQELLAENDEVSIKAHALRGRRSQPQLIRPPKMARFTPTSRDSSDSDQAPSAWTRRP